jgi:hypothetical protein
LQMLPSRSTTNTTNFDPVFQPPAPDPPRNLPPVITSGVVLPPAHSYASQDNFSVHTTSITGAETSGSSNRVYDKGNSGATVMTLKISTIALALWVLLCLLCGMLLVIVYRKPLKTALAPGRRKKVLESSGYCGVRPTLPRPLLVASLGPSSEVGKVCILARQLQVLGRKYTIGDTALRKGSLWT